MTTGYVSRDSMYRNINLFKDRIKTYKEMQDSFKQLFEYRKLLNDDLDYLFDVIEEYLININFLNKLIFYEKLRIQFCSCCLNKNFELVKPILQKIEKTNYELIEIGEKISKTKNTIFNEQKYIDLCDFLKENQDEFSQFKIADNLVLTH